MGSGRIKINILKDIMLNLFSNNRYNLSYIIESADWVIKFDGKYITGNLNKLNLIKSRTTTSYLGIRNQIIHFGSVSTLINKKGIKNIELSNKIVLTWFHIVPNDDRIKFIPELSNVVNIVHTSCHLTKNELIKHGLNEDRIIVIPLGIDLNLFRPVTFEKKQRIKKDIGIPEGKIVIGSFQKDGVGWGEGLEPKLIKGPDIFVKIVEQLAKKYPIYVLLVGPARGYIENELRKRNIPFKSIGYLKNFNDIAKYYHVLDLYLITSRIEGGPKQILEAWASGIPIVSTKVGMVPDIAKSNENVLLAEIEDINEITDKLQLLIENKNLNKKLIIKGLNEVKKYNWCDITKKYFQNIYLRL